MYHRVHHQLRRWAAWRHHHKGYRWRMHRYWQRKDGVVVFGKTQGRLYVLGEPRTST
jgi:hypothetical protein